MDKSVLRVKQYFDLVANEDVPISYAEIVRLANMDFVVALAERDARLFEMQNAAIDLTKQLAERDARIKELEQDVAMCKGRYEHWFKEATKARADLADARAPRVPEGWQLVPKEITIQMIEASQGSWGTVQRLWTALLAAAPQPEQETKK